MSVKALFFSIDNLLSNGATPDRFNESSIRAGAVEGPANPDNHPLYRPGATIYKLFFGLFDARVRVFYWHDAAGRLAQPSRRAGICFPEQAGLAPGVGL
jgi:hypothetical protein